MKFKEIRVNIDTGVVHEYLTPEEEERQKQEILFARAEELKELLERKKARERTDTNDKINKIIKESVTTIKNDAGTKAVYITGSLDHKFTASLVQTPDDNPILLDQSKKYAREHSCIAWANERLQHHEFKPSNLIIARMSRITHELRDLHDELTLSHSLEKVNKSLFTSKRDEMFRYPKITMEWRKSENEGRPDLEVHVDGVLKKILKDDDLPYIVTCNAHWEMKQAWGNRLKKKRT